MPYNFNQDLSTEKWDIKIDTAANYGYIERHRDGTGGGLWFGPSEEQPGKIELRDFDGMTELPQSIVQALRGAGYYLDSTFDPEAP
jgi:hypothetical protein